MVNGLKVLVVSEDLEDLKAIFITLVRAQVKVEVTNRLDEVSSRIIRLQPSLLIMDESSFQNSSRDITLPVILFGLKQFPEKVDEEIVGMLKTPLDMEKMLEMISVVLD